MTLHEAASKVAAEFEYTAKDVNIGVQEFLKQMSQSSWTRPDTELT